MLENIAKVIEKYVGTLLVERDYGGHGFAVCMDVQGVINNAEDDKEATLFYTGTEIRDALSEAVCCSDFEAIAAHEKLDEYAALHPEFLYATGDTLDEAMKELDRRAYLWHQLWYGHYVYTKEQNEILIGFVEHMERSKV